MRAWLRLCLILAMVVVPPASTEAQSPLRMSGFVDGAVAAGDSSDPLHAESASAQLQLGVDWLQSPRWRAHLHLLARDPRADSRHERFGIAAGWVEGTFRPFGDRLRARAGAFFLPTSLEHVDELWDDPYSLTPSALNVWMGEELRPIGVDAEYAHGELLAGLTLFRGNDAFGSLIADRGWSLENHVSLLEEQIELPRDIITTIAAERDGSTGLAARMQWRRRNGLVQLTYVDNRADGLLHGDILTWRTPFYIASAELDRSDWTFAAESGWGSTTAYVPTGKLYVQLDASYALVSRRFRTGRATLRAESFRTSDFGRTEAVTAAWFWMPRGPLRYGVELVRAGASNRVDAQVRYSFSLP